MSPHPIEITHCLSLFLSELWEIGVVIAVQCNGHEGHCSTVFRVRAMTSSGAHENGLKQKLANLLETIGHGSPLVGGAYNALKGMNSWVTFFWPKRSCHCAILATCVPPCCHDEIPRSSFHYVSPRFFSFQRCNSCFFFLLQRNELTITWKLS